jgi:hypothetical protein
MRLKVREKRDGVYFYDHLWERKSRGRRTRRRRSRSSLRFFRHPLTPLSVMNYEDEEPDYITQEDW